MAYGAYDKYVANSADADAALATATALEASTGVIMTKTAMMPMQVTAFGFLVSVTFNYDTQTTEGIVTLKKYVAYGSSSGAKTLGHVHLTDAMAAGEVAFVEINSSDALVKPGEQIIVEITTQAAGGTEVGDFHPFVVWHPAAEYYGNCSNMTKQT